MADIEIIIQCRYCGNFISDKVGFCLDCNPQSPEEIRDDNIRDGFNSDGEPM